MTKLRYRTILLFGAPGAGKGTQGRILGQIPGFFHLSCGDVFRSLDMNSPEGREIYKFSSRGELVPDETTIKIWRRGLETFRTLANYRPAEDLLILDGIPRNRRQAELIDEYVEVAKIVHLMCPDEDAMVHRIRRRAIRENRADDGGERIIRRRFEVYRQETSPVLEFYPDSLVANVNAIGSPAQVLLKVLEVAVPVQNEHFRRSQMESTEEGG